MNIKILVIFVGYTTLSAQSFEHHLRGPTFLVEPPHRVDFSNTSGAWLDCTSSGTPPPTIDWLGADGNLVFDIPGIRMVRRNGTLVLLPFAAAAYRQDIHSTVYRCRASNAVGRIISRDVQVRAVVAQAYEINVRIIQSARGCTAVLRCEIPTFVKEWVKVVSWVLDSSTYIYPKHQGDGKYHVLPNGDLLVHNLQYSTDQYPQYKCRTMHKLTRQVVMSNNVNIRISENHGISTPAILEHTGIVHVSQDEGAVLLCNAQSCPPPEYRWYLLSGPEPVLMAPGPRIHVLGPVLTIEAVTPEDSGMYRCTASNMGGEATADLRLIVSSPLQVDVTPPLLSVHLGGTAEFKCNINSNGMYAGPHMITWYKDGRTLPGSGRHNSDYFILNGVGRDDRGMYQCIVRRAEGDSAQAAAELRLGDAPPVLLYSFIEQTLQPGPSVSLKCSAAGNPTPEIAWTLDGFPLPNNGRNLIGQYTTVHGDVISHVNISQVNVEDGGEYSCIAKNRAGKVSHSARLNVYGPPYIRLIPKVTAVAGETLRLKCPVAGYPIEEIQWEKEGKMLPVDMRQKVESDGTLIVNPVQKNTDMGVYTCWARNKQGRNAKRSGEVSVIVPPKLSSTISESVFNVGERASLTCSVTAGDEPMIVTWLKNGREVEGRGVSVRVVDQFTTILLLENLQEEHSGNYSCVARNAAAEVSSVTRVMVNVPPIIEPFSFQDGLSEGMRTRTVCGVSSGDPPLSITWLKDGNVLPSHLGANVSTLDAYSSLLSFPSLTSSHSGDYTCVATNPAQEARYTAKLQVKVPPRWIVEPSNIANVERNTNLLLNCQATGVPTPTIVWKKALGSKSNEYEELRDRMYMKLFPNGSLLLQNVKEDREGIYLCQANNGIGSPIGKMVQLKVNAPPYFPNPSKQYSVKKGDKAILQCHVNGDRPIIVRWLRKGEVELSQQNNYRIMSKQEETTEGILAEVSISNVEASDGGTYFCQASNQFGKDKQLVQLIVQEPPSSPTNLEAITVTSHSANIHWKRPLLDSSDITKYIVQYRIPGGLWQSLEITGQLTALIEELKPATPYSVRIIAEGSAGQSSPSQELMIKTEPQRPTGPPLHVNVRAVSSTEILVTWAPPQLELRNGDIQGYNVGFRETRDLSSNAVNYNFTAVNWDGEEGGELLLSGLSKYTRYSVVVQAFNQIGSGPLSEPISTQTMEDVPSMPPNDVRCTALNSQSIKISWQPPPPSHTNGKLLGYKVHLDPVNDNFWQKSELEAKKTTALTTIVSQLRKFTNYTVQVLAYNGVGDGVLSRAVSCRTDEDVPGPPADIKVVVSSPASLLISWLPPSEPNGIITKYNLYSKVMDERDTEIKRLNHLLPALQTTYEDKNLQQQLEYQYYVTAFTSMGEGPGTRFVVQIPTSRVPARISSFGGLVLHPWHGMATLPCIIVGQPQPRRSWFKGESPNRLTSGPNYQVMESGELLITGLQDDDSSNYTCQVENNHGSDRIVYNLVVQVPPGAPMLYVNSATSNSVLLHWKPSSSGGTPILSYIINYRRDNGEQGELLLPRGITSYELKNLQCGSVYHLNIVAQNKIGASPASAQRTIRTQGQAPGVPQGTTLIQPNSTSVLLRLHVWPDNGCPLRYFVIQYRASIHNHWTLVTHNLKPQRRFIINDLNPSSVYQLKIEAHNVAGSSMAEFTFVTLTKDGEPPPPEIVAGGHRSPTFIADIRILIPLLVAIIAFCTALSAITFCWRSRHLVGLGGTSNRSPKESLDNQHNAEAQRDRYYATIHKVAINEKIPETSEDISPYATFQLPDTNPPTNALLHSFMYHEQALTEGCASTPPGSSKVPGGRRRSRGKKHDAESDSESELEHITSSRTESANQLDVARAKSGYLYHGTQSSTSSDLSPTTEVKSLPRRGKSSRSHHRWLGPNSGSGNKRLPGTRVPVAHSLTDSRQMLSTPTASSTLDRHELSEAECDIDTIKKLKFGQRSSLWSRPAAHSSHSDYSIAV